MARGLGWNVLEMWGRQAISLLVFIVIARLITPDEFGLVALATVFVSFAAIFVDQGLGSALVQRRTIHQGHLDTTFWVALATGVVLTGAGTVLALPIALSLGEPGLQPIIQVLSLTFVLSALASVQMALLRRELQYRSLALRQLISMICGGVAGITLALLGYGAWALVGQQLVTVTISVLVLWRASPWRPGRQVSRESFRQLFTFGLSYTGSETAGFLGRNTDNLFIGAFLGTTQLGIYALGYRLLDATSALLLALSYKMALPAFSRLQADFDQLRRAYFRVARSAAAVVMPGYIGLALVASELTVMIFGPRWAAAGPVAAVLFLIGPVLAVQSVSGALLMAAGHSAVAFRFQLVTALSNIVGFLIAVPFGILAVAAAYVIRGYLLLPLSLHWSHVYVGISVRQYLGQLRGVAIATIAMAAAVVAVKLSQLSLFSGPTLSAGAFLAAEVLAGALAYLVTLRIVDRAVVHELRDLVGQILPFRHRAVPDDQPNMDGPEAA